MENIWKSLILEILVKGKIEVRQTLTSFGASIRRGLVTLMCMRFVLDQCVFITVVYIITAVQHSLTTISLKLEQGSRWGVWVGCSESTHTQNKFGYGALDIG